MHQPRVEPMPPFLTSYFERQDPGLLAAWNQYQDAWQSHEDCQIASVETASIELIELSI